MKLRKSTPVIVETPTADGRLHAAADRVGVVLHGAADRIGPSTQFASSRVLPLYTSAAGRVTPLYTSVSGRVTPLVVTAAGRVGPYAQQAFGAVGPYATSAKQRGAQAAHEAVGKIGPKLDDAFDKVTPAVEAARGRLSGDLLPRLTDALGAAAGIPAPELTKREQRAARKAAKAELALEQPSKGGWVPTLAVVAALGGAAAVAVRKFLGSKDADWQAARPSAPYGSSSTSSTSGVSTSTSTTGAGTGGPSSGAADDTPTVSTGGDIGAVGGREMGLDDVEVGEKPVPPEERDILPSDPITVLADKDQDGDDPRG